LALGKSEDEGEREDGVLLHRKVGATEMRCRSVFGPTDLGGVGVTEDGATVPGGTGGWGDCAR